MIVLLIVSILAAGVIGRFSRFRKAQPPIVTAIVGALVAICFVAQLVRPELLADFRRDAGAIGSGQAYRLFTALWFQDGGIGGGIFNLAMLGVVGIAAESIWNRRFWLLVYLLGGLGSEIVALRWQPIGAGNSVAYMSLAGSLLMLGLTGERLAIRAVASLGLGAGLLLSLRADVHGIALLIGAALGFTGSKLRGALG